MSAPSLHDPASRKPNEPAERLLVTVEELATILSVSQRTVWRLLSAGKIPQPIRFGGSARWRLTEINSWIEAGCPQETKTQESR